MSSVNNTPPPVNAGDPSDPCLSRKGPKASDEEKFPLRTMIIAPHFFSPAPLDRSPSARTQKQVEHINIEQLLNHPVYSAFAGAGAGVTAAVVGFPLEAVKKMLQRKAALPWKNPREFYRGLGFFVGNVGIATMTAMTTQSLFRHLPGYDSKSDAWNAAIAVCSGVTGAVLGSAPMENNLLTQQNHKCGPLQSMRIMLKQSPFRPWVGVRELMLREGIFTGCYLWAGEAAARKVQEFTDSTAVKGTAVTAIGILGAFLSQPFDALATFRQRFDGQITIRDAIYRMQDTQGVKGFFAGITGRAPLFVLYTFMLCWTRDQIDKKYVEVMTGKAHEHQK